VRSKLPAIGGVAALLAGAGILAAIWSNGTNHSAACAPLKHAPVPPTAEKALAAYAGRIRHDVVRSASHVTSEAWDDTLENRMHEISFGPGGEIAFEAEISRQGKIQRFVTVQYTDRVWMSHDQPLSFGPGPANAAAQTAQANRDKVANGKATVVGRELVDGAETLHLHEVIHPHFPTSTSFPPGINPPQPPAFKVDTWVDPLTYLTVQSRFGPPGPGSVTSVTWLPRTPANIAKTKVVIPVGFRHLTPQQQGTNVAVGALLRCT
jgi:hypothetical protein